MENAIARRVPPLTEQLPQDLFHHRHPPCPPRVVPPRWRPTHC